MRFAGIGGGVLSDEEFSRLHDAALQILAETGVLVESSGLLDVFGQAGAEIDRRTQRARLSRELVEARLAETEPVSSPRGVRANVGIYAGRYLDPFRDAFEPWTFERLKDYVRLAKALPEIDGVGILTSPILEHGRLGPLYERLLAWKLGARSFGSILDLRLCPYIHELHQMRADWLGADIGSVAGLGVFMVAPLRIPKGEGDQLLYFHEKGLRCSIGHMITQGLSGPVTLAGTTAVWLAQALSLHVLTRELYGERTLHLGGGIHPADMRGLINCYGRPESAISQLVAGELARRYGASFSPHTGHADAKVPGVEAGMQKVLTAMPSLIANGSAGIACGLLSIDEVFSPVQMVLDVELTTAMRFMAEDRDVSEETLALEAIREVGPSGNFLELDHTLDHFRRALWNPTVWTRGMLAAFLASESRTAVDRARDKVAAVFDQPDPEPGLTEAQEKEIAAVMRKAKRDLTV